MRDWREEIRARLTPGMVSSAEEHDFVEELAQHLEQEFPDLSATIGPDAARAQLLASLEELSREKAFRRRGATRYPQPGTYDSQPTTRDPRPVTSILTDLAADALYALRRMRHAPQTAALTILTMGIGIGATTAIFSVVDAVALRPLPIPDANRVVSVFETNPTNNSWSTSDPNFLDFRDRTRSFSSMAAISFRGMSLIGRGDPVALNGFAATASYFDVMGARPLLGRVYTAENDRPGGDTHVVVLSEGIWRRQFGADPKVVSSSITLDGTPYVVLGIMPRSLSYFPADFWIPLAPDMANNRGNHVLSALAKLKPGVTVAQANADIVAVAAELSRLYPKSNGQWGARVEDIMTSVVGPTLPTQLMLLFAAVGFLLLLACVNVANLLLGKALVRQREISVRAALGADRGRIARQLITESMIVSLIGGVLGVGLARASLPLIQRGSAANVPRLNEVVIDGRVLMFALGVSLLTGALFGLAPALHAARASLQGTLREGSRSITGAGRRVRDALVAIEVALAVLLLVGAGLLGRSFVKLIQVPTGFAMAGALQLTVPSPNDLKREDRLEFYRRIERGIAATPGVASVGASSIAPFSGGSTNTQFLGEGHDATDNEFFAADWRTVSPGYFKTLDVRLLRGRLLDETDDLSHPMVAVLDSSMAERLWPGQDPIGKWIMPAQSQRQLTDRYEVVGVVRNVRDQSLINAPPPAVYFSSGQRPWFQMTYFVKGSGQSGMATLVDAVQQAVRSAAPSTPVPTITPLEDNVNNALAPQRFTAGLLSFFAAIALLLAAIGLYGVVSFNVQQRTTEMGVRLAFGATPGRLQAMVMRDAGVVIAIGLVVGCAGAVALSRLLASMLYATETLDVLTYVGVVAVITVVAAIASYAPAQRASRTDPLVAIRDAT
ncbi:MAG TPA: ABC transporter permease [Gemmatimonadaceae bacterium]|nr:ABC transporter permease [Gemmatimonadaceae bacterium]